MTNYAQNFIADDLVHVKRHFAGQYKFRFHIYSSGMIFNTFNGSTQGQFQRFSVTLDTDMAVDE